MAQSIVKRTVCYGSYFFIFIIILTLAACNKENKSVTTSIPAGYYSYDHYTDTIIKYILNTNNCTSYFEKSRIEIMTNMDYSEILWLDTNYQIHLPGRIYLKKNGERGLDLNLNYLNKTMRLVDSNTSLNRLIFTSDTYPDDLNDSSNLAEYPLHHPTGSFDYMKVFWNDSIVNFYFLSVKKDTFNNGNSMSIIKSSISNFLTFPIPYIIYIPPR